MDRKTWIALGIVFSMTWLAMWMMSLFEVQMCAYYFLALWLLPCIPGCIALIFSWAEKLEIPFPEGRFPSHSVACLLAWILGVYISYNSASHDGSWFLDLFFVYPLLSLLFNGIGALGLSLFWWGYFYKKLNKWHPLRALLLIGILSGLWCAPLVLLADGYYFRDHRLAGLVLMPLFNIAISPLMFYFRYKSGSIIAPALFFALLEGSHSLGSGIYPTDSLTHGPSGIPGITVLAVCSCIALGLLWLQGAFGKQKNRVASVLTEIIYCFKDECKPMAISKKQTFFSWWDY
jgi:hypothetical protein